MACHKNLAQPPELAAAPVFANEIAANGIFAGGKGYINTRTSKPPIAPLEGANGFLIIFKNKKQEVIAAFSSQQDKKLDVQLKYERHGGLKSGTIRMQYGNFPYYNDMLVEIRMGLASLGHMYVESFALKDNMLDFTLYSSFRRFNDKKYSGNAANMTIKDALIYFLKMIKESLDATGPEFFRINPDKILPQGEIDDTVYSSIFFIDKTAKEIFAGFAVILGSASYGIDEDYDFYFYTASFTRGYDGNPIDFVAWEDFHIFNLQWKTDDSVISNQCNLYSKRQGSASATDKEELVLLATGENTASQNIYGKKEIDVNLPFYLNSTKTPRILAAQCLTPKPAVIASFNIYNPDFTIPPYGLYQIVTQVKDDTRILFNSAKTYSDSHEAYGFEVYMSNSGDAVYSDFLTGDKAYQSETRPNDDVVYFGFRFDDVFHKRKYPSYVKKMVVAIKSDRELEVLIGHRSYFPNKGDYGTYDFETTIKANPVMGFVEIDLPYPMPVGGISFGPIDINNPFVIDSVYYIPAMTQTIQGLYDGHTVNLNEREVKMTISLGHDNNDLVEQLEELSENAKLADQLAKQANT